MKENLPGLIVKEISELVIVMTLADITFEDLELDHEDKIIMNQFSNINYTHDVDPKYFEKGLRVVRRIAKKVDECLKKRNFNN